QIATLDAPRDVVDVDGAAGFPRAFLRDLARAVAGNEEDLVAALGVRRLQALERRRRVRTLLPERALHVMYDALVAGTPVLPTPPHIRPPAAPALRLVRVEYLLLQSLRTKIENGNLGPVLERDRVVRDVARLEHAGERVVQVPQPAFRLWVGPLFRGHRLHHL